jgi:hypothetical protein
MVVPIGPFAGYPSGSYAFFYEPQQGHVSVAYADFELPVLVPMPAG